MVLESKLMAKSSIIPNCASTHSPPTRIRSNILHLTGNYFLLIVRMREVFDVSCDCITEQPNWLDEGLDENASHIDEHDGHHDLPFSSGARPDLLRRDDWTLSLLNATHHKGVGPHGANMLLICSLRSMSGS